MSTAPTIYEYKKTSPCGVVQITTQIIHHKINNFVFNIICNIEDCIDNSYYKLNYNNSFMHIEITILNAINNSTPNYNRLRYCKTHYNKDDINIIKNYILTNNVISKNVIRKWLDNKKFTLDIEDANILKNNLIIEWDRSMLNVYIKNCYSNVVSYEYDKCEKSISELHKYINKVEYEQYNFKEHIKLFDELVYNSDPSNVGLNKKTPTCSLSEILNQIASIKTQILILKQKLDDAIKDNDNIIVDDKTNVNLYSPTE